MATTSKSTSKATSATKVVAKKATPVKKEATKVSASKSTHVSDEAIRNRAIEIYIESGCVAGRDVENWMQAERELKGKKK